MLRPWLAIVFLVLGAQGCGTAAPEPRRPADAPPGPQRRLPEARAAPSRLFAASDTEYAFLDPERRSKLEAAFPEVERFMESKMATGKLPGAAVGIVIDGQLAYGKGFGFIDVDKTQPVGLDTAYRIASVTKVFTSAAVLSLRDDGTLSLDAPLTRWIPEAAGLVYPTRDSPPITIRHLLTHTSGLPRVGRYQQSPGASEAEVTRSLAELALEQPPGLAFSYSNLGYALLGIVVGRAGGASTRAVVAKRIFEPLGMTSTSWDPGDVPPGRLTKPYSVANGRLVLSDPNLLGGADGAGGLYTTLRDMARFMAFELGAYPPQSGPERGPLRRSTVRESHLSGLVSNSYMPQGPIGLYTSFAEAPAKGAPLYDVVAQQTSFGWSAVQSCDFDDLTWANGGGTGYGASLMLLRDRGVGVVTMFNVFGDGTWIPAQKPLELMKRTGALEKRAPRPRPGFAPALAKLMAVYDAWSEDAYWAMNTRDRAGQSGMPRDKLMNDEREQLAAARKANGACSGLVPIGVDSPSRVRFEGKCERGKLEMLVELGADGLIKNFSATSHGVLLPADERRAAERLVKLIDRWDTAAYGRYFGAARPVAQAGPYFEALRAAHGKCALGDARLEWDGWKVRLECERGGGMWLGIEVDAKAPERVVGYSLRSASAGVCPVR